MDFSTLVGIPSLYHLRYVLYVPERSLASPRSTLLTLGTLIPRIPATSLCRMSAMSLASRSSRPLTSGSGRSNGWVA